LIESSPASSTVMRSTINLQSDRESSPASSTVMRSTINLQSDRESIPASSAVMRSTINLQSVRDSSPASSTVMRSTINTCSKILLNYVSFQSVDNEGTWWWLFQKRVVRTILDIYGFICHDCRNEIYNTKC
jgi:hypothetical protein